MTYERGDKVIYDFYGSEETLEVICELKDYISGINSSNRTVLILKKDVIRRIDTKAQEIKRARIEAETALKKYYSLIGVDFAKVNLNTILNQ